MLRCSAAEYGDRAGDTVRRFQISRDIKAISKQIKKKKPKQQNGYSVYVRLIKNRCAGAKMTRSRRCEGSNTVIRLPCLIGYTQSSG